VKLGDWIYDARRSAVRNRLVDDEHLTLAGADELIGRWEADADRRGEDRGSPNYWRDGARWMFDQLPHRDGRRQP